MSARVWLGIPMILLAPALAHGEPGPASDTDPELLREVGIGTSASELLVQMRKWCGDDDALLAIDKLARDLDSDLFEERDAASKALVRLGAPAMPMLESLTHKPRLERSRRAARCLKESSDNWNPAIRATAVRRLVKLRPAGAAEALLRQLPYAWDEALVEELYYGLYDLAKAGKAGPALAGALADRCAERRAAAACIVGRLGPEQQRKVVRALLKDSSPTVRLRAAQGLLAGGDAAGVPTLIELLGDAKCTVGTAWQAEELLRWAAHGRVPEETIGAGTATARQKCRDSWQAWWKKAAKLDWPQLARDHRRPGLLMISRAEEDGEKAHKGHLCLLGCDGTLRWRMETRGVADFHMLQNDRILLSEELKEPIKIDLTRLPEEFLQTIPPYYRPNLRVCERDLRGQTVWRMKSLDVPMSPFACKRLPNGNTIAYMKEGNFPAVELTRGGEIAWKSHIPPAIVDPIPWQFPPWAVFPGGRLLYSYESVDRERSGFFEYDPVTRKEFSLFQPEYGVPCFLANGHCLFEVVDNSPGFPDHTVTELDQRGRSLGKTWWYTSLMDGGFTVLRNGNLVKLQGHRIREIFPDGRIAWDRIFGKDLDRKEKMLMVRDCHSLVRVGFDAPRRADLNLATDVAYCHANLKSKDPFVRAMGLYDSSRIGPTAIALVPSLIESWTDPESTPVAAEAVTAVGPGAIPYLWKAMKDKRLRVRMNAIKVLGSLHAGDPAIMPAILAAALKAEDANIRHAALTAAAQFGLYRADVLATFIAALKDTAVPSMYPEDGGIASHAAVLIGDDWPRRLTAVRALIEAAKGKDFHLRCCCIDAIAKIRPKEDNNTMLFLIKALAAKDCPDPEWRRKIRASSIHALARMGYPEFGEVPASKAQRKIP